MIRVIAGRAKGRRLRMVKGDVTRPISDRVKESLFNILGQSVPGCRFLDLFAGTGGVGIEALSRDANYATFVERHPAAIEVIRANLDTTGLAGSAVVVQSDVFGFLERATDQPFDIVYVAPPQYAELWSRSLRLLDRRVQWLNPDAWVVAQLHPKEYLELELRELRLTDQRVYGRTMLAFYSWPGT